MKYTRGRALDKNHSERYNLQMIQEKLKQNDLMYEPEQVLELYDEKEERYEVDFDYQVKIERWQVHYKTKKGYYVNVDGGRVQGGFRSEGTEMFLFQLWKEFVIMEIQKEVSGHSPQRRPL